MAPASGRNVGHYEIEDELGHGGMGLVYLARQPDLERRVVLKTLRKGLAGDRTLIDRFQREARTAAAIHHQNVVAVYDAFAFRSELYIAQEYVDGMDLASVLKEVGRLPGRIAGLVALEIARGLEEIHARGVVHRDLKPSNLLVGRAGEVKIADFGIVLDARGPALTETGHTLGTPAYMSPEQLRGDRVDPRSDLFALGVVMYEMLSGRLPFDGGEGDAEEGLLRRIETGRLAPLRRSGSDAGLALRRVAHACLRAKTRRRVASATLLRRRLEHHLGAPVPSACRAEIAAWLWARGVFEPEADETAPLPAAGDAAPPRIRRWLAAAAAGLALAATVGALAVERDPVDHLVRTLATVVRVR